MNARVNMIVGGLLVAVMTASTAGSTARAFPPAPVEFDSDNPPWVKVEDNDIGALKVNWVIALGEARVLLLDAMKLLLRAQEANEIEVASLNHLESRANSVMEFVTNQFRMVKSTDFRPNFAVTLQQFHALLNEIRNANCGITYKRILMTAAITVFKATYYIKFALEA